MSTLIKVLKLLALPIVVFIGLLAGRPLFEPRLVHGTDTLTHLYLLVHLDDLFQQGIYYSRWLPYRISGLGAPVFQYYPPLASYAAQGFNLLGLEELLALRLTFGLTLIAGAIGTYLWVRDILDKAPAVVAATAYVCGPHVLFNTFFRGGLTEQFALMFAPFVLWAFRRLALTKQARYFVLGTICYAAMIPSHPLTTLVFSPLLLLYALMLTLKEKLSKAGKPTRLLWAAIPLGLGLAAFFWLPALLERSAVRTDLMYGSPAFDYHFHFIPLMELFATPWTHQPAPAISLVAACLAMIGLLTVQFQVNLDPLEIGWAALAATVCAFMALPTSVVVWDNLPMLRLFQFPHRFLGPATLLIAFLAAVGSYNVQQWMRRMHWPSIALPFIAVGLLVIQTRVLEQVHYYPPLPEIDVKFIMQKEREAAPVVGEFHTVFIPSAVKAMPPFEILARDGPERLDLDSLPSGAKVLDTTYKPLYYSLVLSTPRPFAARFNTFYFPGWLATVDGEPVAITPTVPYGLISVAVPAGEHRLEVWFGSTPVRRLANGLSISSLLLLLGAIGYEFFSRKRKET